MVLVQNSHFSNFFFQAIQIRKMSFTIFKNEKMPFQAIKTRSSKSPIIDIFVKGLTHGLGPIMAIFPNFFPQAIQTRKMSFTIFQNEKMPFQAIKTRSSKTRKINIFQLFFLGNIDLENVFYNILERKNAFPGYKKKKFEKCNN